MDPPLLVTKLFAPPRRRDRVHRPRLLKKLDQGLTRKLTLISAPAGYGKTTLLSDWMHGIEIASAWLSLDPGDNDPNRLLQHLRAAIRQMEPAVVEGPINPSPQQPPLSSQLTTLINDLAESAEENKHALILDDYHCIESKVIHDGVEFLLEHLPSNLHLVIGTRYDPPVRLSRFRAQDQLIELRARDLTFTPDEARAYLTARTGNRLSDADIVTLQQRTEGWIVGLQLAALSLRDRDEVTRFIRDFSGSHRHVLDYLTDEVLDQQTPEVRDFLLRTSILDRLCGPLCDAVTDGTDGQERLDALEAANLFVVPLDDERNWYRYHHLFAELLRHRLRQTLPEETANLHHKAADWLEAEGMTGEAIDHALKAGDPTRAATLVEAYAFEALDRGQLVTLNSWLNALPNDLVAGRPWLSLFLAWTKMLSGHTEGVEEHLASVEASGYASGSDREEIEGNLLALQTHLAAFRGDAASAQSLGRQALIKLPPERDNVRSSVALTLGGSCLLNNDLKGADEAFHEAVDLASRAGNPHVAVPALSAIAWLQIGRGELRQAATTCHRAEALATNRQGKPLPVAAQAYANLVDLHYEWNELEQAEHHLEQTLRSVAHWGNPDVLIRSRVSQARLAITRGELDAARQALEQADGVTASPWPGTSSLRTDGRLRLWQARGDEAALKRWLGTGAPDLEAEPSFLYETTYLGLARVLIAAGDPNVALALLQRWLEAAEAKGRIGSTIALGTLRSLAEDRLERSEDATKSLRRALYLAESEGYLRTFIDEGSALIPVLENVAAGGDASSYARKILAVIESQSVGRSNDRLPPLIEPLSPRESTVLRLLSGGMSNKEIARELDLSVNTVKVHTQNIYGKLAVKSRLQAVQRARDLKLI